MGLNLFGSSKKEGDKTYNYDNRQDNSVAIQEGDLASGAIRSEGDVTITDGGAFDLAGDVTDRALDFGETSLVESFGFGRDSLSVVSDNAAETYAAIDENNRRTYDLVESVTNKGGVSSSNTKILMFGLFAVAGVALWSASQ